MVATGRTTKNRPPESVSVKGHVILQVDDMMTTRTTKAPPSSFVGKSSPFRNHKFRLLSCMGASLGTALNSRCTSTSSPFIERWVVLQDCKTFIPCSIPRQDRRWSGGCKIGRTICPFCGFVVFVCTQMSTD